MATKKLTCTADVSISQKYSGQAYNSADRLAFGSGSSSGDAYYVLLNFSSLGLSSTAYKVTKAVLTITKIDGAIGYNASFYARAVRVTSSWSESTTYDTQPSVTTTGASASVSMGTGHSGSVSLDITSIVQSWLAGSAQYGVRLEKTTSGTSLLKCIGSRGSSSAAYITVTYENKNPAPTAPAPNAPGKITGDRVTLSWGASSDNIFSSGQLAYRVQINFGGGDSSSFYTNPGVTSLTINLREYLGLRAGQYYYAPEFTFAVSAYTPAYNGTIFYGDWARSSAGSVDYRITPGAPGAPNLSNPAPYEGQSIHIAVSRPSTYNSYNASGGVMQLTYKIMTAAGMQLASVTAPATSSSASVTLAMGSLTTGRADLSTQVYAICTDQAGQSSGQSPRTSITVKRFRAPTANIASMERTEQSAVIRLTVSDTGYGSSQGNAQIASVEYKLDSGAWDAATPTWTGLTAALTVPGLSGGARYALSVRATNLPPDGLAGKTSEAATATILEYTPAMMVFRDSANGATGIAAKSLIVGNDWNIQAEEGTIVEDGQALKNKYAHQYSKINNPSYWGICLPDGTENGWLRAPSDGIIPNINDSAYGSGKLGTPDFPWKEVHSLKLFTNGSQPLNELTQWTPTLGVVSGSGTAPTVSYSSQVGRSWRFGWVTFFYFRVVATITSPGTGYALINGLPFACLNNHYFAVPLSENAGGFSDGSNANKAMVYRGTYIRIQSSTGTSAVKFANASPMYLSGSGWYEIN